MLALLLSPIGRYALAVLVGVAWSAFAYHTGYKAADQRAKVAELQVALAGAYQDLNAQRVAAEQNRLAAEENRKAAEQAERIADEYESELKARGEASACRITDDDLRRLQHYGHGADATAPARR
jgi:methylthioribose-1-phosphate isomerase